MDKPADRLCSWSFGTAFVLLLLLYFVSPLALRILSGAGWTSLDFGLQFLRGAAGLGALSFLGWWYWRAVPPAAHGRLRRAIACIFLPLLAVGSVGAVSVYKSLPTVRAARVLANAELASLPASAGGIRVMTWSTVFSGEQYLLFRASPEDIQRFVSTSPILRTANIEGYEGDNSTLTGRHVISPRWYVDAMQGPGRRYEYRPRAKPRGPRSAKLTIDETRSTVFVHLSSD